MPPKQLLLACMLIAAPVAGQDVAQPIVIGERSSIESRVLDETRQIYVGTPQSYMQGTQSYGVVYVLDAETNFSHTIGTTRFLAGPFNQAIPPLIVVGIGTTDRMRDLTPPSQSKQEVDVYPTQGGADDFLRFIVDELRPWVDEHYRTNGYSILIGHSLAGLFALHTLVTAPDSFNSYIAIDPSLWWNDQALLRQAATFMDSEPDLNASLYLAVGIGQDPGLGGARELTGILDTRTPPGLRWEFARFETEPHEMVALPATYQGLRWLFASWNIDEEVSALFDDSPAEELLADIEELYQRSGEQLGFQRETPYFAFESLLNYLAGNDRLDEAAALTLQVSDRFPLLPNVINGIASMYASSGNGDAAMDFLRTVLEKIPDNETARRLLAEMGAGSASE